MPACQETRTIDLVYLVLIFEPIDLLQLGKQIPDIFVHLSTGQEGDLIILVRLVAYFPNVGRVS